MKKFLKIQYIIFHILKTYQSTGLYLAIAGYIAYTSLIFLILDSIILGGFALNDPTYVISFILELKNIDLGYHMFIGESTGTGSNPPSDPNIDLLMDLFEKLFKLMIVSFQPSLVQGHFDDLVGQRMFIQYLLFLICFFVFILFIVFIWNVILILNKERILGYFKNKYILLFLKFEIFNSKIFLFIIPFFILFGLFTLGQGLLWLLINPIPYESLGVDLHQYVSSEKLILCIMIKNFKINPHPSVIINNKVYKPNKTIKFHSCLCKVTSNHPWVVSKSFITTLAKKIERV